MVDHVSFCQVLQNNTSSSSLCDAHAHDLLQMVHCCIHRKLPLRLVHTASAQNVYTVTVYDHMLHFLASVTCTVQQHANGTIEFFEQGSTGPGGFLICECLNRAAGSGVIS